MEFLCSMFHCLGCKRTCVVQNIWASSWESVSSRVSDQVGLKLACSATEASMKLDILVAESRDITLSRQRTIKALIRQRRCAGWTVPLLFAYDIRHVFSRPGSIIQNVKIPSHCQKFQFMRLINRELFYNLKFQNYVSTVGFQNSRKLTICCNYPKIRTIWLYHRVCIQKMQTEWHGGWGGGGGILIRVYTVCLDLSVRSKNKMGSLW